MFTIITDCGNVKLTDKNIKWLESFDMNWAGIIYNKKKRSKKAKLLREKFSALEAAVSLAAEIEWFAGGKLVEY